MATRRERMERRLTELEHRSGTQGMRLVFCPATVSDADYPAWHRENAAPIEGDERRVFVVRFVEPKTKQQQLTVH